MFEFDRILGRKAVISLAAAGLMASAVGCTGKNAVTAANSGDVAPSAAAADNGIEIRKIKRNKLTVRLAFCLRFIYYSENFTR